MPTLRDALLLRRVRERVDVEHLDVDPGDAAPVPPAEPGIVD